MTQQTIFKCQPRWRKMLPYLVQIYQHLDDQGKKELIKQFEGIGEFIDKQNTTDNTIKPKKIVGGQAG